MATADLSNTLGAEFIGGMISAILYGITTLQTYLYFMNYPDDGVAVKLFVMIIWILDTVHVSFMCHALYYYLVSNYGVASPWVDNVWSLYASITVNLCIACLVQTFFTVKIFYLCHRRLRWLVTIPIIVTILAHLGFGTVTVTFLFSKTFSASSQLTLYSVTTGAANVVSDVLITIALCVLLRKYVSYVVCSRAKRLINTLIIYTIDRCLLTSLVTIAEVVMSHVDSNTSWYVAIDFILSKLYANSLLASLNTRNYLRSRESVEQAVFNVNTIQFASSSNSWPPDNTSRPESV
ncbi:hypothetical protein J3A83DRAFT_2571065 [Scleroderma citrinum]